MEVNFSFITLIALIVALLTYPLRKYADRQAQLAYIERVGEQNAAQPPEKAWLEDRHLVGRWGCLYILLQAIQGVAIIVAIGGLIYWWLV